MLFGSVFFSSPKFHTDSFAASSTRKTPSYAKFQTITTFIIRKAVSGDNFCIHPQRQYSKNATRIHCWACNLNYWAWNISLKVYNINVQHCTVAHSTMYGCTHTHTRTHARTTDFVITNSLRNLVFGSEIVSLSLPRSHGNWKGCHTWMRRTKKRCHDWEW